MTLLFSFLVALFLTSALVPPLMRLAPRLGLIDRPSPRKIHTSPVPLCGGLAIAAGALVAVAMWGTLEPGLLWSLAAAALILGVGARDDARPLHYGWRLLAQSAAAALLLAGGVHFGALPLLGLDPAPWWLAAAATLVFVVASTNAVNLTDGMDGLAGGLVIPSLLAIALLARQSGGAAMDLSMFAPPGPSGTLFIACAALSGAVLGFLRFNSHPASVFLGDAGSTFLGFATAVLAVLLVQRYNPLLSPAIVLPLMGVPLLDTLYAVVRRLSAGRSPFIADDRHLHHQLLALGLTQVQGVAALYGVQAVMVLTGVLLRYESDVVVLGAFALIALVIIVPLARLSAGRPVAARRGEAEAAWTPGRNVERRNPWLRRHAWLPAASLWAVKSGVAAFVLLGAVAAPAVPRDIAVLAAGSAGLWLASRLLVGRPSTALLRIVIYAAAACAAYLVVNAAGGRPWLGWAVFAYLAILAVALALAIRVTRRGEFRVTPQDLLVLFLALAIPNLSGDAIGQYHLREIAAVLIVLFYATEYVIAKDRDARMGLDVPALACLVVLGVRGLL